MQCQRQIHYGALRCPAMREAARDQVSAISLLLTAPDYPTGMADTVRKLKSAAVFRAISGWWRVARSASRRAEA